MNLLKLMKVFFCFVFWLGGDLDVSGDESETNNVQIKDLGPKELENIKVDGHHRNVHLKIWAFNILDTWCLYTNLKFQCPLQICMFQIPT
jgi:hypothetical protein